MNASQKRQQLRELLAASGCTFAADVYDPMSARIAEDLDFQLGMMAGSVAAMTVLGAPDLVLLTLSEFAEQARRICRAGNLPLLVDADHGYGNALNVRRTVEELETAGVAALTIEDTLLPAPFAGNDKSLTSIEEGIGKIRAALSARQDSGLVIVARTAAATIENVASAVARAKAYERAGADALFFSGIRNKAQLETLRGELALPILLGAVPPELGDRAYLASQGVRICLQGHKPFLASVRACYQTLKQLADGVPPEDIKDVASGELLSRAMRRSSYDAWTKDFLTP